MSSLSGPIGLFGPGGVVALGGSRTLSGPGAALAGALAVQLVEGGRQLVTGCAKGADAAAVSAVVAAGAAARLQVCAAFGPVSPSWRAARYSAPGAWSGSAVSTVAGALLAGASVSWWAGGGPSVPLSARLAQRTRAVAQAATAGALVVLAGPHSAGSLYLASLVARRGLPVVAVAWGFPLGLLPELGAGRWVSLGPAGAVGSLARWVPGQGGLAL